MLSGNMQTMSYEGGRIKRGVNFLYLKNIIIYASITKNKSSHSVSLQNILSFESF